MNISEAEEILHDDTHENDGTYTLLRLGLDPGAEALHSLVSALRIIRQRYSDEQSIPHQVAFCCGIILHFDSECIRNLKAADAPQSLIDSVDDLNLAAFNALAGNIADEWSV